MEIRREGDAASRLENYKFSRELRDTAEILPAAEISRSENEILKAVRAFESKLSISRSSTASHTFRSFCCFIRFREYWLRSSSGKRDGEFFFMTAEAIFWRKIRDVKAFVAVNDVEGVRLARRKIERQKSAFPSFARATLYIWQITFCTLGISFIIAAAKRWF